MHRCICGIRRMWRRKRWRRSRRRASAGGRSGRDSVPETYHHQGKDVDLFLPRCAIEGSDGVVCQINEGEYIRGKEPGRRVIIGEMPGVLQGRKDVREIPHVPANGRSAQMASELVPQGGSLQRFADRFHVPMIEAAVQDDVSSGSFLVRPGKVPNGGPANHMEHGIVNGRNRAAQFGVGRAYVAPRRLREAGRGPAAQ